MNESDESSLRQTEYREHGPPRVLHPYLACTWQRHVPDGTDRIEPLILPDGCIDLTWREGGVHVAGPDTAAWRSSVKPGETVVGVRLRPGVGGMVLGMPAAEVRDEHPPGEEVFGQRWLGQTHRIDGEAEPERAREELLRIIRLRLARAEPPDSLVLATTRRLGFAGSRVSNLADALGISERQLRRRFHAAVGYGPKVLDRVLRFSRFARLARAGRGRGELAWVAADLGYSDQAHLTRECIQLSGLSPRQLLSG